MSKGNSLLQWIDARYPLTSFWKKHVSEYYAPKNFNIWYVFGVLSLVVLVMQILTGIFLTMHYKPSAKDAFDSVEYIMRDVPWGSLIRYMHSTGASAFFIVIYLHMFRGIMYGSYRQPRELVWLVGMLIYIVLMAEAFMGYLLPWGQMSYWGAQVIVNLFSVIPFVGESLAQWIRGDYVISDATLNRFFAFHVIALPLFLALLVFMHIVALHHVGSNNPDGVEIKKYKNEQGIPLDGINFWPYHVVKDIVALAIFFIIFFWVIFFMPDGGGLFLEHANFEKADPLNTPENIAPVWYFTPFYAILRAVPSKLGGVSLMGLAVLAFAFLPWLDRSPVRSIRYKGWLSKMALTLFVISFVALGWLGLQKPTELFTWLSRLFALLYFAFFITLPFVSKYERCKTPPDRINYSPSGH